MSSGKVSQLSASASFVVSVKTSLEVSSNSSVVGAVVAVSLVGAVLAG